MIVLRKQQGERGGVGVSGSEYHRVALRRPQERQREHRRRCIGATESIFLYMSNNG